MVTNFSTQYGFRNGTMNVVNLVTTTNCGANSSTPVYDHNGAMRFTVAVVLVYGIGVIGVLGIYVRRKPSESLERDANVFVKGLSKYREDMEKKMQLSAVHKFISSIHGEKWRYSPSSTAASTPIVSPEVGQSWTPLRNNGLDSRSTGSPCSPCVPLLTNPRRQGMFLGLTSQTVERQDSIPETEEDEEYSFSAVTDTPGSDCSLTRPVFTLRNPPIWSRRGHALFHGRNTGSADNSSSNLSPSPEEKDIQDTTLISANQMEEAHISDCKRNGRFTVIDVQDV